MINAFVISVYLTLLCQLAITYLTRHLLSSDPILSKKVNKFLWIYIIFAFMLIIFITFIPMPIYMKFVIFSVFSVFQGLVLNNITKYFDKNDIRSAVLGIGMIFLTFAIFGIILLNMGITLKPFAGYLAGLLIGLIVASVIVIFIPLKNSNRKILLICGLIIFSLYVSYDTNVIFMRDYGGDYISAALSFYLDIINIFIRLLDINR